VGTGTNVEIQPNGYVNVILSDSAIRIPDQRGDGPAVAASPEQHDELAGEILDVTASRRRASASPPAGAATAAPLAE
jgi:hypothetical protein